MRVNAKSRRSRPAGVAEGLPLSAPVGGWDGISALANMPEDRAYQIDNWIARPGWIEPRKGYVVQCTGLGSSTTPVQTLMAYNGVGAANKLFAVAAGAVYDVTTSGVATKAPISFANSRVQHTMFANPSSAQNYLIAVSGADTPRAFDGSSWIALQITGTGFDPTLFVSVAAHKGRLWFVPDQSTNVVYLDTVGGIQGSAHVFPLGQIMSKGGYVMAVGTWTADQAQTVDEFIAFVTSRGQVIVYQGTDPSTQATWSLVGVYNLGSPVGRRCLTRIAGDLLIITLDGVTPMSQMLNQDRGVAQKVALTANILNPMAQAAQAYRQNFGWSANVYAKGTLLILNIPIAENYRQMQFVMNTITGAWSRFYDQSYGGGLPANCWEIDANDNAYFGGNDGSVYRWDVGSGDNGQPINCLVKTAYNGFGNAAQLKRFSMLQPLITTTGNPIPSIGINVDFNDAVQLSTEEPLAADLPKWDAVIWDQFQWPKLQTSQNNWISVDGLGHYVSVVTMITTRSNPSNAQAAVVLQLNGWNLLAERGAYV